MDARERACICGDFLNEVASCRDLLIPILTGEITRCHCVAGEREATGGRPGKRKTTLKDARAIAKSIEFRLNRAMNKFDDLMENDR
jgi:hypothetical protein